MANLINLTRKRGETGEAFYLNADKIITVEGAAWGAQVFLEPLNRDNSPDWENVTETPAQIAKLVDQNIRFATGAL